MNKEDALERTAAGSAQKNGNGRVAATDMAKYDASVRSTRRPSRAEVEARLESTSASITSRLGALQREVTDTGESLKKAVTENAWLGIGAALVGGLAVGFLLTRPRGRKQHDAEGPDEIAALLTRSVQASLAEGNDPTDDVAQLLDRLSKSDSAAAPASSGSLMRSLVMTLANAGIRYALSRAGSSAEAPAREDGSIDEGSA